MKKISIILISVILIFCIFACEKQDKTNMEQFINKPEMEQEYKQEDNKQPIIEENQDDEKQSIEDDKKEEIKQSDDDIKTEQPSEEETIDVEAVLAVFQDVETVSYANGNIVDLVCESFDGVLETNENEVRLCYEYTTNGSGWNLIRYFAIDNYGNYYRLLQVDTGIIYDEAVDVLPCIHTYQATNDKIVINFPKDYRWETPEP